MLITLLEIVMVNLGLGYDKLECPPGTPVGGPPTGVYYNYLFSGPPVGGLLRPQFLEPKAAV